MIDNLKFFYTHVALLAVRNQKLPNVPEDAMLIVVDEFYHNPEHYKNLILKEFRTFLDSGCVKIIYINYPPGVSLESVCSEIEDKFHGEKVKPDHLRSCFFLSFPEPEKVIEYFKNKISG